MGCHQAEPPNHLPHEICMNSSLQFQLYDQCCDGLSGLAATYPNADTAAVRSRIRHELKAMSQAGVLSQVATLAKVVQFAKEEGVPISLWGRPTSSAVLFAIGLNPIDPVENKLTYEAWHTNPNQNPFKLPGGLATTFAGRDKLREFFQDENAEPLESWIMVCLKLEAQAILADMIGPDQLECILADGLDIIAQAHRPIPREVLSHMTLFKQMPYAEELANANLRVDDIAALYALARKKPIAAGLLDKFIQSKINRGSAADCPPDPLDLFKRTPEIPIFQEDVAMILNQRTGIDLGTACRIIRSIANSAQLDRRLEASTINELASAYPNNEPELRSILTTVTKLAPFLASKSLSYDTAQATIRTAVIENKFSSEWKAARATANWIHLGAN